MQYSYINGQKVTPFPKGKGTCDICGAETLAKCGEKKIWHWAHKSKLECDPWWENETEWHREWKEKFPDHFREVVHLCEISGEKHRADIKSDSGIILEIQNSPISLEELRSRENFYKNLLWIVNGKSFQNRFQVFNNFLPNPNSKEFDDIVFFSTPNQNSCTMFWRKSQHPTVANGTSRELVEVHSVRKIQRQIAEHYIGNHPFHWKRAHAAWLEAKCPVFIDFGTDILWRFESYRDQFVCVRAVSKSRVISDIINQANVQNIAQGYSVAV
jgi:competence protein CoiA